LERIKMRVRKKGQVTLPQKLREKWGIDEGSEVIILSVDNDKALIKPVRKTNVRQASGSLGEPTKPSDEIEFATLDPELLARYYSKKYR
jgi:AbrB family looped-hinge helix DNA binding protein